MATGFRVLNGKVIGPSGAEFVPHGVALGDQLMGIAVTNAACSPLLDAAVFQGLNLVRLACDSYQAPAYYNDFITKITAKNIVVHIEDHSGADGGSGVMFSASKQQTQANWYAALASAYKANPYVTFGSFNEPSNCPTSAGNVVAGTVTKNQILIYNAIRGTGSTTLIEMEMVGGGTPDGFGNTTMAFSNIGLTPASAYASMTNIVWGPHFYYWMTNMTTNTAAINAVLDNILALCGAMRSGDGQVPVWITEFGPTLSGEAVVASGLALCQAVFARKATLGAFAWAYGPYDATNSTTTGNYTTLTAWGQKVRTWLQTATPTPPVPPTPTVPTIPTPTRPTPTPTLPTPPPVVPTTPVVAPSSVRNLAGTVSVSAVALTWTAPTQGNFLTYQPQYRIASATPTVDPAWRNFGNPISNLSVVINNLLAATQYDFQIVALNTAGTLTSPVLTLLTSSLAPTLPTPLPTIPTTSADIAPSSVRDLTGSVFGTSVTLTWLAPVIGNNLVYQTKYRLSAGTLTNPVAPTIPTLPTPTAPTTPTALPTAPTVVAPTRPTVPSPTIISPTQPTQPTRPTPTPTTTLPTQPTIPTAIPTAPTRPTTPTVPNANFKVSNGKVIGPSGAVFVPRGVAVGDQMMGVAATNAACSPLLDSAVFQGLNLVRLACDSYQPPAYYNDFITKITAKGIVVHIEDHSGADGGSGVMFNASKQQTQAAWYAALAAAYKSNAYVTFGTLNEPSNSPSSAGNAVAGTVTKNQVLIYNAIRGAGSNTLIEMEMVGGGTPDGFGATTMAFSQDGLYPASAYASMTNIVWGPHFYYWMTDYTTNTTTINAVLDNILALCGAMRSGDGQVPVWITEFGPTLSGEAVVASGLALCQAVFARPNLGAFAWAYGPYDATNSTTTGNYITLTTWGQKVRTWLQSAAPVPIPAPTTTPTVPTRPTTTPTTLPTVIVPTTNSGIVTPSSGGSAIDLAGDVWTLDMNGLLFENGTQVPGGEGTSGLTSVSGIIWAQDGNTNTWYTWDGASFTAMTGAPPLTSVAPTRPTPTAPNVPTTITNAARVNDFLKTIGINGQIQSYNSNHPYANAAGMLADARFIGARLWRDGLNAATSGEQLNAMATLANAGFKFSLVPSTADQGGFYTVTTAALLAQAHAIQALTSPGPILALEGANEPINWGLSFNGVRGGAGQPWTAVAKFQAAYYAAIKADVLLSGVQVWGVSQTGDETPNVGLQYATIPLDGGGTTTLAAGTKLYDSYNIHIYPYYNGAVGFIDPNPAVFQAAYDQYQLQLKQDFTTTNVNHYAGPSLATLQAAPKVITEMGLSTAQGGMTQTVRAKNLCNGYLIAYLEGFSACFSYELYEEGDQYGWFSGTGMPTMVATYMHNLTTVLADSGSTAASFAPGFLGYTLTGLPSTAQSKLFQRSDGTFLLAIWNNVTNLNVTIGASNVTVTTLNNARFSAFDITVGTAAINTIANAKSFTVALRDYPMIVTIANTTLARTLPTTEFFMPTEATVPTTAAATFKVSGGQIIAPNGSVFIARGINISDFEMASTMTSAAGGPMTTLFPKINIVRVACYDYGTPSEYQQFVTRCTGLGIVVLLENHQNFDANGESVGGYGGGLGVMFTGQLLATESAWFTALANTFKNNTYVWFGTCNEPPGPNDPYNAPLSALSTWQRATYNAIRNTGASNIITLELWGGGVPGAFGTNGGMTPSIFAPMTNVIYDWHQYGWMYTASSGKTGQEVSIPQASIQSQMLGFITTLQQITSADGKIPVFGGESGNSTTGESIDPSGQAVVQAIIANTGIAGGLCGAAFWEWDNGGALGDMLTNVQKTAVTSPYGTAVVAYIKLNATPTAPTIPTAPTVPLPTSGAVPGKMTVLPGLLQSNTVSITWQPPTGTPPFTYWTAINGSVPASTGAGARNFSGLTPGTSYTFTVYATNAFGTGPVSNAIVMTTTGTAPPTLPTPAPTLPTPSPTVVPITPTPSTPTVVPSTPTVLPTMPTAPTVVVPSVPTPPAVDNWINFGNPISGTSIVVSGLALGRSFDFEIIASNGAGSAISAIITLITGNSVTSPTALPTPVPHATPPPTVTAIVTPQNADEFFQVITAGAYDSAFLAVFQSFVAGGYTTFYIRPGYEMNRSTRIWNIGSSLATAANFVTAFQRIADLAHNFSGAAIRVIWNPYVGSGSAPLPYLNFYPGDRYVDVIGVDTFGGSGGQDPTTPAVDATNFTVLAACALAKARGKTIALPETGINLNAQAPSWTVNFINGLAAVIKGAGVEIEFVSIWDYTGSGAISWSLPSDHQGAIAAAYKAGFGVIPEVLPSAITAIEATTITLSSLSFRWSVPASGDRPFSYQPQIRVVGSVQWLNLNITVVTSATANNLLANTAYDVQVVTSNSAGSSVSAAAILHTATILPNGGAVSGVQNTGSNQPVITAPINAAVAVGQMLLVTGISVYDSNPGTFTGNFATAAGSLWMLNGGVYVPGSGTKSMVFAGTINELNNALTSLQYAMLGAASSDNLAINIVDPIGQQNTATITLTIDNVVAVPGQISNLKILSATSTSMTITWQAPTAGTMPYVYQVQYRISGSLGWANIANSVVPGTSFVLTGLTPSTGYDVEVIISNSVGMTTSTVVSGNTTGTASLPPSSVQNLVVSAITGSTISLSWAAPAVGTSLVYTAMLRLRGSIGTPSPTVIPTVVVPTVSAVPTLTPTVPTLLPTPPTPTRPTVPTAAPTRPTVPTAAPTKPTTPTTTAIITPTSGGSVVDGLGNVWSLDTEGNLFADGDQVEGGENTGGLTVVSGVIWARDLYSGTWYTWDGESFNPVSGTPGPSAPTAPTRPTAPTTPAAPTTPGTPGSYFRVSGGRVLSPSGAVFVPHGLAVGDQLMDIAVTNAACSPLLDASAFQGLNLVRLACDSYQAPAYYSDFISKVTAKGIVVHIEDHSGADGGGGVMFNASRQQTQANWYAALASAYKSNPYVTFGTLNEPSNSPNSAGNAVAGTVTKNQVLIYNAIRGTGSNTLIEMEMVGGGTPDGFGNTTLAFSQDGLYPASAYASMTNIVWGPHFYYWMTDYTTDDGDINAVLNNILALCGAMRSGDGQVPVWITEFGPTLSGEEVVDSGLALCQAVFARKATLGAFAWAYGPYDATNSTTEENDYSSLTPWGEEVRAWLRS